MWELWVGWENMLRDLNIRLKNRSRVRKLPPCVPSSAVRGKSSTRLPAVTWYLVELFGIDELEEVRRGVQLVGQPGPGGKCGDMGS
eukprot:9472204-Pyramimonas_sp.AAC.1